MIYLDTAAIIKLIRPEPQTDALVRWLHSKRDTPLITSALAEVEVPRGLRRTEPELLSAVPGVLARLAICEIDETVRATAAAYQEPVLRSLDAIHLATAEVVLGGELTAFVTYDRRLLAAASAQRMPVAHPD